MENNNTILEGYSDTEKGAYLGAIASIATADRKASEEELEYLANLSDAANLSEQQKHTVIQAATELSGDELTQCLQILKNSKLKYPLITDLIAFAKIDGTYSAEEGQSVQKIAQYLEIDQKQFSLLDQFANKTTSPDVVPEETTKPNFLSSVGLQDKMQQAGIDTGSLMKGFLGIAGPMLLAGMLSGGMRGGGLFGGGMFGSGIRGGMMGGGLGSLIGMLSGGRSYRNTGGLFDRILGGRF